MRKILFCFLAFLLVVMIALIASVGLAQPMSEPASPYVVWSIPVTDVQAVAGITAVVLLAVILVNVSSGALCSMSNLLKGILAKHCSQNEFLNCPPTAGTDVHTFRPGVSWRTPLIKPMLA
jgi:hypothetical protein